MKENIKITLIFFSIIAFIVYINVGADGLMSIRYTSLSGIELLQPISGNNFWNKGLWTSHNDYPTIGQVAYNQDGVTLYQKGEYIGFYAASLSYGNGPSALKWSNEITLNVSLEKQLLVSYTGRIDKAKVDLPLGWLAMGIDFWFDVKMPNGELKPFEFFVHFYEEGIYKLPVGAFNNFGLRQDYDYTKKSMGTPWYYTYTHQTQDKLGEFIPHSFLLNDYVEQLKQKIFEFKDGEFYLMRIEVPIEMMFAEGSFTANKISLLAVI